MPFLIEAQCSMCTKTAAQLGEKPALGLNNGILYLMLAPFAVIGIIGWVINIVKLFTNLHSPITGLFILRVVGIFVPIIGAVMGWL